MAEQAGDEHHHHHRWRSRRNGLGLKNGHFVLILLFSLLAGAAATVLTAYMGVR